MTTLALMGSMTPLQRLSPEMAAKLSEKVIDGAYAISLYYCSCRRNAWHRTRSTNHLPGFFPKAEAAQASVQWDRKQGSVFLVHQLPTLLLTSGSVFVAITQTYTLHPLEEFRFATRQRKRSTADQVTLNSDGNPIRLGRSLVKAVDCFEGNSEFWVERQWNPSSIVRLVGQFDKPMFDPLPSRQLLDLKSYPTTYADFPLDWKRVRTQIVARSVRRLVALANKAYAA